MDMTWEKLIEKMHKIRNDWSVIDWLYHVFYFVKDKITTLEERCTALEARCTALEQRVVEIFEEISGLKEKDEEQDEAIDNILNRITAYGISTDLSFMNFSLYSEDDYITSSFECAIYNHYKTFFGVFLPNISYIEVSFGDGYITYSMDSYKSDFIAMCSAITIHRASSTSSDMFYLTIGFKAGDISHALGITSVAEINRMVIHVQTNEIGRLE